MYIQYFVYIIYRHMYTVYAHGIYFVFSVRFWSSFYFYSFASVAQISAEGGRGTRGGDLRRLDGGGHSVSGGSGVRRSRRKLSSTRGHGDRNTGCRKILAPGEILMYRDLSDSFYLYLPRVILRNRQDNWKLTCTHGDCGMIRPKI